MAIISRKHARQLVADGKAIEEGILKPDLDGIRYVILKRMDDSGRRDHYAATEYDIERFTPKGGAQ